MLKGYNIVDFLQKASEQFNLFVFFFSHKLDSNIFKEFDQHLESVLDDTFYKANIKNIAHGELIVTLKEQDKAINLFDAFTDPRFIMSKDFYCVLFDTNGRKLRECDFDLNDMADVLAEMMAQDISKDPEAAADIIYEHLKAKFENNHEKLINQLNLTVNTVKNDKGESQRFLEYIKDRNDWKQDCFQQVIDMEQFLI